MAKVLVEFGNIEWQDIWDGYEDMYPEHEWSVEHYIWEKTRKKGGRDEGVVLGICLNCGIIVDLQVEEIKKEHTCPPNPGGEPEIVEFVDRPDCPPCPYLPKDLMPEVGHRLCSWISKDCRCIKSEYECYQGGMKK